MCFSSFFLGMRMKDVMGAVICSFKPISTYIALVVPGVTVGVT